LIELEGFMKWVGLTGGLGTGKSTVAQMLVKHGIPVIDADRIARQVVEPQGPAYAGILRAFGPGVINPDGSLDRQCLARIVFNDEEKRLLLERLIHPCVQSEVASQRQWLKEQRYSWAVYDVPLLFEKGLQSQFDSVIVVSVTHEQIQYERLKERNGWNDEEIHKRLSSQVLLAVKVAGADHVIQNDADIPTLQKKVDTLVQMLNDLWLEDT
jgi:dephospho-CoA kinase